MPEMSIAGLIVSQIVAQLCLENSIQTLCGHLHVSNGGRGGGYSHIFWIEVCCPGS